MADKDRVQVITPDGRSQVISLEMNDGVATVGSAPDSTVLLDAPGIAEVHALLIPSTPTYQVVLMSDVTTAKLNGQVLLPHSQKSLSPYDEIQLDGHTLIYLMRDGVAVAQPVSADGALPTPESTQGDGSAEPGNSLMLRGVISEPLPDVISETVRVELSARRQTVVPGQAVAFGLTIFNTSERVLSFKFAVDGLGGIIDELGKAGMIHFSKSEVRLYGGKQEQVTLTFRTVQEPWCLAGIHALMIRVNVSDTGGYCKAGAQLQILPYFDFECSEPSPREQGIIWKSGQGTSRIKLNIANKGNSVTKLAVIGEDSQANLNFTFTSDHNSKSRTREINISVAPGEVESVYVELNEIKRRTFSLGWHRYNIALRVNSLDSDEKMMLPAMATRNPILAWLCWIALLLFLMSLIGLLFLPKLDQFGASDGNSLPMPNWKVNANQEFQLHWRASNRIGLFDPFYKLRIEPNVGSTIGFSDTITQSLRTRTTYRLYGENLLTGLLPDAFHPPLEVTILVTDVQPKANLWVVSPLEITVGDPVTLTWNVSDTESLLLNVDGKLEPGERSLSSTVAFRPQHDTSYELVGKNYKEPNGLSLGSFSVKVNPPPPVIVRFIPSSDVITRGQKIDLDWKVENATYVQIIGTQNDNQEYAPEYKISDTPADIGEKTYTLLAYPAREISPITQSITIRVNADFATPNGGDIAFAFAGGIIAPNTTVRGNRVTLKWSVPSSIPTTQILLGGPGIGAEFPVTREASYEFIAQQGNLYLLIVKNGDKESRLSQQLIVLEPTATPLPTSTSTPTPTPSPTPIPPVINFFRVVAVDNPGAIPPPTKEDIVSAEYELFPGTLYRFEWKAVADKVLFGELGKEEEKDNSGQSDPFRALPDTFQKTFSLKAKNNDSTIEIRKSIVIRLKTVSPPAPTSLSGEVVTDGLRLHWNQGATEQIVGFRIYRASRPPGTDFGQPIVDERTLKSSATSYTDKLDTTCGRSYYIVAVYYSNNGAITETNAGDPSWNSPDCIAPTITPVP